MGDFFEKGRNNAKGVKGRLGDKLNQAGLFDTLNEDVTKMKREFSNLERENQSIKGENDRIKNENEKLKQQIQELQNIRSVHQDSSLTTSEIKELREKGVENIRLKEKMKLLYNTYSMVHYYKTDENPDFLIQCLYTFQNLLSNIYDPNFDIEEYKKSIPYQVLLKLIDDPKKTVKNVIEEMDLPSQGEKSLSYVVPNNFGGFDKGLKDLALKLVDFKDEEAIRFIKSNYEQFEISNPNK